MSEPTQHELPKNFAPEDIEAKWYETWEKGQFFSPKPGKTGKSFSLVMPPPNVTGRLHAGHALDITTQDAIIRFKRMKGFETVFIPGMDHAGIATQNVVEKMIKEQDGKTKHDLGREDFIKKVWEWKEEYGGIIENQQKVMGASADWENTTFTMDPESNEAVNYVFTELYNEGLIYQADYIVNWDPVFQSAISDAEVEHKEVQGHFYHILYSIKGSEQQVEIATTRPETLLGDTAVCVNPKDVRFRHLIGKTAIVPICNREVPIIGDEYVDMEKGTGCLKVTPGHDFNDFEIGKRHKLPIIKILNADGTLNKYGLEFKGMDCKTARPLIIKKLQELGCFIKQKPHLHSVGHGDRSGAVIEPMVSKQWFLNVQKMAKESVEAVESDQTRFYPKNWENTFFSWMREPKDWCISRQLWWGHQIPIFYCRDCDATWATAETSPEECLKCKSDNIYQDPDVLDTWFSSALWPMTTLGWPNEERMKERGFHKFFTTDVLITGFDIIFFWVARMMMMSLKFAETVPFKKVYIHAIVRDKFGRKMSKSLNNGIDPLDMVNQYGADAFRFALAAGSGYNRNINLDPERVGGYKNFINKIWNAFRFISPYLESGSSELPNQNELDSSEKWIIGELNQTTKEMNLSLEEFRYDEACSALYSFIYDKFCSWFIELSKPVLYGQDEKALKRRASVLKYSFRKIVALLHPISPFITEELWSHLKTNKESLLIVEDYPEFSSSLVFEKEQTELNRFLEIVTNIRNLRLSANVPLKEEVSVSLFTDIDENANYLKDQDAAFLKLARVKNVKVFKRDEEKPAQAIMSATSHTDIYLELEDLTGLKEQIKRLEKELAKTQKDFDKYDKKLSNPKFLENAKEEAVTEAKYEHEKAKAKREALSLSLKEFKSFIN